MSRFLRYAGIILAMPVASHAETNLKFYGLVDLGVAWQNRTTDTGGTTDTGAKTGLVAGTVFPILLGVNGSHELGNENQLVFQLEGGTNFENGQPGFGTPSTWGRSANVGLSGKWGSVRGGFQLTPFLLDIASVDPQSLSQAGSAGNFYVASLGITGIFDNRMLQYRSPTLYGLNLTAGVGSGNLPRDVRRGLEVQGTASFAKAGFNAAAGYLLLRGSAASRRAAESFWVGAGHNFATLLAPVTLKAMVHDIKTQNGAIHTQYFAGGVAWAITSAFTAKYGYYDYRDRNVSANKTKGHTIAINYAIDQSTNTYAGSTLMENRGTLQVVPMSGSSWGASGAPVGMATSALYAGLNHAF